MKTYTKSVEEARLVIRYDEGSQSPRLDSNIGHFFTKESRSKSPDGTEHELYDIMLVAEMEAESTESHIKAIERLASEAFKASEPKDGSSHNEDLHIIEIHPVYKYEHGNVSYRRGTAGGFDYSNCGFYIVTAKSISGETHTEESIARAIDAELEVYTKWANGEVYRFTLYDENGVEEDSCGGFYDIEDIRESLPEDWKDEELKDYFNH